MAGGAGADAEADDNFIEGDGECGGEDVAEDFADGAGHAEDLGDADAELDELPLGIGGGEGLGAPIARGGGGSGIFGFGMDSLGTHRSQLLLSFRGVQRFLNRGFKKKRLKSRKDWRWARSGRGEGADFASKLPHVMGFISLSPNALEPMRPWMLIRWRKPGTDPARAIKISLTDDATLSGL